VKDAGILVESKKKVLVVLNRHLQESKLDPWIKLAASLDSEEETSDAGSFLKRAIPKGYAYDSKALKPLAKMLWAMSVALGHALTAHRQFTKVKSSTISPDGLIGGRGYVMSVKDVRKALYDACEWLSTVSDTIHDELNAPHWKPKLAELEKNDIESVERLVGDAERILDNPEEEAEEDIEKAEETGTRAELEEGEGSKVPDGGDFADSGSVENSQTKQAYTYRRAISSDPVNVLPGPRVEHRDRGDVDQTGPFGSHNIDEPMSTKDEWSREDGAGSDYPYQSEWDNELLDKTGNSNLPGKLTDNTPTEGYDYGLGYGEGNDAHGQGAGGYGTVDSDGKQVYGPYAQLPDDPGAGSSGESDSTPAVELAVGRAHQANSKWKTNSSKLPLDIMPSVARADYYEGDKGDNEVNATSSLPGVENKNYEYSRDSHPGVGYRYEQGRQQYVKWDSDTHNMELDPTYQRELEGPFEREG
jgi:hypothetical protein